MKRISFILLSFFFLQTICAQDTLSFRPLRQNSVFIEGGGHGGVYSMVYEKNCKPYCGRIGKPSPYYWHFGFSFLPYGGSIIIDFPVSFNRILGKGKHKAEIGTGQVFILDIRGGKGGYLRGTIRLGYRFEPAEKRYYLKFAYTPFYSYLYNFQYNHWGGIAFGYYLKK
ncbi:MAG: hypothetical protein AB1458_09345 [Bacteroidota bacterium]